MYPPDTIFQHDGSPEGFLTALREARRAGLTDAGIPATGVAGLDLFSTPVTLASRPEEARAFLAELAGQHGTTVTRRLMYLYYSESPQAGALALAYLRLLDQFGPEADQHLTDPAIRTLQQLCQQVGHEIHRFKGLLRFAEMDPATLRAVLEPDFNILIPVALYFRRRLGGQSWLIVDAKRRQAAHWDQQALRFMAVEAPPRGTQDEITRLWQAFYRSVAIPDRKNEKLRRQHMPERYWKYLSEW